MSESLQWFEVARSKVGFEVSVDIAYVQPPGERHFDPLTVAITFGGMLVLAFANGFVEAAKGQASEWGKETANWLGDRAKDLFRHETSQPTESELDPKALAVLAEYDKALMQFGAKSDQGRAFAETAEKALVEALQAQGFPPKQAEKLAGRVREMSLAHAQ